MKIHMPFSRKYFAFDLASAIIVCILMDFLHLWAGIACAFLLVFSWLIRWLYNSEADEIQARIAARAKAWDEEEKAIRKSGCLTHRGD